MRLIESKRSRSVGLPIGALAEFHEILRSYSVVGTGMFVTSLLQITTLSLLARDLPHDVFGQMVMVMAGARLASGLVVPNVGPIVLGTAAGSWFAGRRRDFADLFWPLWRLEVLSGVCASFLIGTVTSYVVPLWTPSISPLCASMAAFAPLASATSAFAAWLRMHGKFLNLSFRDVIVAAFRLCVIFLAPIFALPPSAILALWFAAELVGLLFLASRFESLRRAMHLPGPRAAPPLDRRHFVLAYRCHSWAVMRLSTLELDTLIIGLVVSDIAAGVVRIAKQWALLVNRIAEVKEQVIFPRLAEAHELHGQLGVSRLERITFIAGVSLVSAILSGWLLVDRFVIGLLLPNAVPELAAAVRIQMLAFSFYLVGVTHVPRLLLAKRENDYTLILFVASTLFFVSLLMSAPVLGALAAPVSHLLFNVVWFLWTALVLSQLARQ